MSRKSESPQVQLPIISEPPPSGDESAKDLSTAGAISTKEQRREFFLPVSGFIWFYPEEVEIIDHPAFQRLGRIYQLGQTYVVYRGATHKRLEHVLGTVHVVQRMCDAVQHNSRKGTPGVVSLDESERRFIRLGALLHDIGHMAAGHTVEDELNLAGKHDGDERLTLMFEGKEWRDSRGRSLATVVDTLYEKYLPSSLRGILTASRLVRLLIRKTPEGAAADQETAAVQLTTFRLKVCCDMIGNTICADILDYIYRDWYHIGKPRPFEDRLLQYMEIRKGESAQEDRFVISLGKRPKIRTDAISAILDLLEWRYQLAESVLFHRTKLSAAAMLDRALFELWGSGGDAGLASRLLPLSDEEMLSNCIEEAKGLKNERGEVASGLLQALSRRDLYSPLITKFYGDLPADIVAAVGRVYGGDQTSKPGSMAANRNRVLRVLESDFKLPDGALAMYCGGTNPKIAKVKIAFGEDIDEFSEYEKKHNNHLSGGHLDAQLSRFRRLWRVHFFIKPEVRETLGERLYVLQQAIEKLALGNIADNETCNHAARSFATLLTLMEGSPWAGMRVADRSVVAAYQDASTATGSYPFGAASIKSYISPK